MPAGPVSVATAAESLSARVILAGAVLAVFAFAALASAAPSTSVALSALAVLLAARFAMPVPHRPAPAAARA
ncbi:hypothetical protein CS379_02635 [Methylobacterium frigidaeris]|nr:hypothetical protein CS379_02635 [Methylobacterium frigidaeris]